LAVLRCAASSRRCSRRSFTNSHTAHPSGTRNPIPISIAIKGKPPLEAMVNVDGHHAALSDSIAGPSVVVVALRCCHYYQDGGNAELALGVDVRAHEAHRCGWRRRTGQFVVACQIRCGAYERPCAAERRSLATPGRSHSVHLRVRGERITITGTGAITERALCAIKPRRCCRLAAGAVSKQPEAARRRVVKSYASQRLP
jgi:hypothetical protein